MTDRIRSEFERWATGREFPDLTQSMGRYNRAVVRWMWEAWQEQSERITDMAAALDRSHKRSSELLKQCRDHDTRRAAAVAQAAALAAEVERLNVIISRLSVEGQDAWRCEMDKVTASIPASTRTRNYFGENAVISSNGAEVSKIADGYADAAEKAARSARRAIATPNDGTMAAARWDEAVAQTLEKVLCLFDMSSDECDSEGDEKLELPRSGS